MVNAERPEEMTLENALEVMEEEEKVIHIYRQRMGLDGGGAGTFGILEQRAF